MEMKSGDWQCDCRSLDVHYLKHYKMSSVYWVPTAPFIFTYMRQIYIITKCLYRHKVVCTDLVCRGNIVTFVMRNDLSFGQ